MPKLLRLAIIALCTFSIAACGLWGPYDNPADNRAANYQGFDTVIDADRISIAYPKNGGSFSGVQVTGTKVASATTYALRIATSEAALGSSHVFEKSDYASNIFDIRDSGILDQTSYYLQACASLDHGATWGAWCGAVRFTTNFSTPAATPTFEPPSGIYSSDKVVTISCTTPNAKIYYTTDGTTPTTASTLYAGTVAASVSGSGTTIKAIATGAVGYSTSAVGKATYAIFVPMVRVDGGTFSMGSAAQGDAQPVHTVTVSSFKMSIFEITQAQYEAVTGINPSYFEGDISRPVERVSWYDAVEFCNRLSEREGLESVYTITGRSPSTGYPITSATVAMDISKSGYRLPTEAEWEYAARGGANSHGYTYAGSNTETDVTWYVDNSGNTMHPVGTKAANELGLYDLSGNAKEWCWDWFGGYGGDAQTNPLGLSSGVTRVLRGGSWEVDALHCTVFYRDAFFPDSRWLSWGFRVVSL
jgi:formylglycine-generating enzyme